MTDNDMPQEPGRPGEGPPDRRSADGGQWSAYPQDDSTPGEPPRRGSISYQDAHSTAPREPTLAERRARQAAIRREQARAQAAYEQEQSKATRRKRVLIGTGVTVGVVALVAVLYNASQPDEVTAQCVDENGVIVDDDYCDDSYARSHGGYVSGGFIYIGGTSYRYNYGGTGTVGQRVTGGSYVKPSSGTTVRTNTGKTVQRGGLGVGGSGKSGGS